MLTQNPLKDNKKIQANVYNTKPTKGQWEKRLNSLMNSKQIIQGITFFYEQTKLLKRNNKIQ